MEKIVRESVTDQVFDLLKTKILSGEWKVGEKIPSENELSANLGVSRNSLRLATQKLNVLGLTETKVGDGTYVKAFSLRPYICELYHMNLLPDDHEDIRQFKYAIEDACIQIAVRNGAMQEDIRQLKDILQEMEIALRGGNYAEFQDADFRFHFSICNMTRNKMFVMIYDAFSDILYEEYSQSSKELLEAENGVELLIEHHRNIIGAIERELKYSPNYRQRQLSE